MLLTPSSAWERVGQWSQATQRAETAWYAKTLPSTDLIYLQCHASTDEHIRRLEFILPAQPAAGDTLEWQQVQCYAVGGC